MTYTFTRGDKTMMLHGYDIDSAMTIADLMIKQTIDGYWKFMVGNTTSYTWKEIVRNNIVTVKKETN